MISRRDLLTSAAAGLTASAMGVESAVAARKIKNSPTPTTEAPPPTTEAPALPPPSPTVPPPSALTYTNAPIVTSQDGQVIQFLDMECNAASGGTLINGNHLSC